MKAARRNLTLLCISCSLLGLMAASSSFSKIDPQTIVGLWLLDEGGGELAKDASGNGHDGSSSA